VDELYESVDTILLK